MSTIAHLIVIWSAATWAIIAATFRRLLLGPRMPTWTWRTEWTVASARAVLIAASRYRDDPTIFQLGLRFKTPVPPELRKTVTVRRVKLDGNTADRYMPHLELSPKTTLLYFHGGGYLFGNPGTHRQFIARIVAATGASAIAPRYRLAPRHRYPAAVDDAERTYEYLLAQGIAPETIVLGGDSAGGGLAMALLHRIRTEELPMPAGAMLFSPYLDLEHTGYTLVTNASTDYLPGSEMEEPNSWYADPDQLRDPGVSPLYAPLEGFPPLLVFAGGAEMLLADSLKLFDKVDEAGVDAELVVEPEMMHVWPAIVDWEPASRRAFEKAADWVHDLEARR